MAHYVLLAFGISIGLSTIGVDFTNLAVLLGALGIGIGFGLQDTVANFIAELSQLVPACRIENANVEINGRIHALAESFDVKHFAPAAVDHKPILFVAGNELPAHFARQRYLLCRLGSMIPGSRHHDRHIDDANQHRSVPARKVVRKTFKATLGGLHLEGQRPFALCDFRRNLDFNAI
ncbi:MAG: mechanosensitive ion channel [Planctomycetes bacterium]|nr:mechanosensitive ion channel [Planctomycetota bacterium]